MKSKQLFHQVCTALHTLLLLLVLVPVVGVGSPSKEMALSESVIITRFQVLMLTH